MSDLHKMSAMMKDLFPSDPAADRAALQQMAGKAQETAAPAKDFVNESVDIPEGSIPFNIDSMSDFAALAGVRVDEKQKTGSAGQAKGSDPMPAMSTPTTSGEQAHPLKDKLVGEDDELFEPLAIRQEPQDAMSVAQRQLKDGMKLIAKGSAMIDEAQAKIKELTSTLSDRTLTKGEENKKEKYVKGMKKNKGDFEKRYGDDAKAVMYATATKMAKETTHESIKDRLYAELAKLK